MLTLLSLSALASPCTDPAKTACWEGEWSKSPTLKLLIRPGAEGLMASLILDGDTLNTGPLGGSGAKRQAPLDGCGGDFVFKGDTLTLALDGPECPVDFIGTFQRSATAPTPAPTLCGEMPTRFSCATTKGKTVSVCGAPDALVYRFGSAEKLELTLEKGAFSERALASGMEKTWTFENKGYGYAAFEVLSRPQDTSAGVLISKDGKDIATVTCAEPWFTAE